MYCNISTPDCHSKLSIRRCIVIPSIYVPSCESLTCSAYAWLLPIQASNITPTTTAQSSSNLMQPDEKINLLPLKSGIVLLSKLHSDMFYMDFLLPMPWKTKGLPTDDDDDSDIKSV